MIIPMTNCLAAARGRIGMSIWDLNDMKRAKAFVPQGCRKVPCDGVSASITRCKEKEHDVIVFLSERPGGTPDFHAIGRKIGRDYGWNTSLLHMRSTRVTGITDPEAHLRMYFPGFAARQSLEKLCFCCCCD